MSRLEREAANILKALDFAKIRATYGAVGAMLGVHPRRVTQYLGNRRPLASWVVNAETGEPTDYLPPNKHPDLMSNPHVIDNPEELRALVEEVLG